MEALKLVFLSVIEFFSFNISWFLLVIAISLLNFSFRSWCNFTELSAGSLLYHCYLNIIIYNYWFFGKCINFHFFGISFGKNKLLGICFPTFLLFLSVFQVVQSLLPNFRVVSVGMHLPTDGPAVTNKAGCDGSGSMCVQWCRICTTSSNVVVSQL